MFPVHSRKKKKKSKIGLPHLINTQTHLDNFCMTLTPLKSFENNTKKKKKEIHTSAEKRGVFLDKFKIKDVAVIFSHDIFVL